MVLGKTIEACIVHKIPFTVMRFPDVVLDSKYCYDKLSEGLKNINKKKFEKLFDELSNPKMIKFKGRKKKKIIKHNI